jgi:L-iditol 2-dehydrogenase
VKAVYLHGRRDLQLADVPRPQPGDGELLIEVRTCGVCPGDIRAWLTGSHEHLSLPANTGHEAAGVVVEAGWPGGEQYVRARVFADGYGGFAEYKTISRWTIEHGGGPTILPPGLAWETAVFVEPLADCLFAVEVAARATEGTWAVVVGCGQMGLQIVRLCVLAGLRVAACDPELERRRLATRFGAVLTVPNAVDLATAVRAATGSRGADSGFLTSPTATPLPQLADSLAEGGRCVLFSSYPATETAGLTAQAIHHRRLTLVGSRWIRGHGAPRFDLYARAANLLATGLVDVAALDPLHVPPEELTAAMQAVHERSAFKAVVVF